MKAKIKGKYKRSRFLSTSALALVAATQYSHADTGSSIPIGVVGMILCAGLVLFMQAGFALLESGSVRSKNSINVVMKNYTDLCAGMIVFWAFGYGLMYGANQSGYFGASGFFPSGLTNDGYVSFAYQVMFAATAATIMSGAVAERMRYWSYVVVSICVTGFIYPIFGSWVWAANGWLANLGFIDLAGSAVVHAIGGWCAMAAAIVVGPRTGRYGRDGTVRDIPGHNLSYIALGGFILWLGWFGFNAGSAKSIDDIGLIVVNTQLAGAGGAIGALFTMVLTRQPVLMTTTVNGVLGGLVASCAGASILEPGFALFTGVVSGTLVVASVRLLTEMNIDDVVGAVSVHAVGGSWGVLAVGLFFSDDMFDLSRVTIQITGIISAFVWGFGATFLLLKLVDAFFPLRASKLHEQRGLDYSEHYEVGYTEFQSAVIHQGKASNVSQNSAKTA